MGEKSRIRRGTRHQAAKLKPPQVLQIRRLWDADVPVPRIREQLSLTCCDETVRKVGLRRSYRDVPEETPDNPPRDSTSAHEAFLLPEC